MIPGSNKDSEVDFDGSDSESSVEKPAKRLRTESPAQSEQAVEGSLICEEEQRVLLSRGRSVVRLSLELGSGGMDEGTEVVKGAVKGRGSMGVETSVGGAKAGSFRW